MLQEKTLPGAIDLGMVAGVGQEALSNLAILEKPVARLLARAESINLFEGTREVGRGRETTPQGKLGERAARAVPHLKNGFLEPQPPDESVQWFAGQRTKDPVKMERREVGQPGESLQIQWFRQILADMVNHILDATKIDLFRVLRAHA